MRYYFVISGTPYFYPLAAKGLILFFVSILGDDILFHMNELGRKPPLFEEALFIAEQVLDSGYEFEAGEMLFNKFK